MENFEQNCRRSEPRYDSYLSSILIKKGQEFYTTIVNISATGLGMLSNIKLELHDIVEVIFAHNDFAEPLSLKMRVHTCAAEEDEYRIGGSLAELSLDYHYFFSNMTMLREK